MGGVWGAPHDIEGSVVLGRLFGQPLAPRKSRKRARQPRDVSIAAYGRLMGRRIPAGCETARERINRHITFEAGRKLKVDGAFAPEKFFY